MRGSDCSTNKQNVYFAYLLKWKFGVDTILFNSIKTIINVEFSFLVICVTNINYICFPLPGHAVCALIL